MIIFDGKTGDKLYDLGSPAHTGSIYSLCWDPNSGKILSVSGDKTAKLWDVEGKTMLREFKLGDAVDDQQVGCLWQNGHVLSVSLSGKINYLNINDGGILRTVRGHTKSVTALAVANTTIFSASHDGLIIHWNAATGDMGAVATNESINQHSNQVNSMAFHGLSNTLVTCGLDDTIKFIDTQRFVYT